LESLLEEFIRFYNTQRYHGAIGYVIPEQRHNGTDKEILAKGKLKNFRPENGELREKVIEKTLSFPDLRRH